MQEWTPVLDPIQYFEFRREAVLLPSGLRDVLPSAFLTSPGGVI